MSMQSGFMKVFRRLAVVTLTAGLVLATASSAIADKLHLKDGRVLEGTVVREGKEFVFFRIKVGTVTQDQMFTRDQILKVEKDDPAPKDDEALKAKEDADKKAKKDKQASGRHSGATRVAILNFGPPSDWQGSAGDMVGVQVSARAFQEALPKLKEQKVDVVVVRVNSGGGYGLEVPKFNQLFEKEYKPNFRTVAWIESAISAAAMSPWVIEEMYFMEKGNIGACTGWSGALVAVKGVGLEISLADMEVASKLGKKDPKIMRAMQIMAPLSYDIDASGNVVWRQDALGKTVLNLPDRVYTMTASEAVASGFGRGIANTKEDLARAMGLQEVEWVGQDISKAIDDNIRENDRIEKRNGESFARYQTAMGLAQGLQDKQRRGQQISIARRALEEIRRFVRTNPNFMFHFGVNLSPEWFQAQEEELKRLGALP
ncbi:MAG: hypothetical protein K2Q20_10975 [Phycisphaerales bacterium]|nr:hypothetical protein [Phycisphaerales bacterium]